MNCPPLETGDRKNLGLIDQRVGSVVESRAFVGFGCVKSIRDFWLRHYIKWHYHCVIEISTILRRLRTAKRIGKSVLFALSQIIKLHF